MPLQLHVLFMLYKAKQNSKGLCPLVARITYQKQRKQVATGYFLTSAEWERLQSGKRMNEKLKQVSQFIGTFKGKINRIANALELEGRMELDTLMELYLNKPKHNITLLALFRMHNEELAQRITMDRAKATFDKYCYSYDKLQQFIHHQFNKPDVLVSKLDAAFMQLFYDYLLLQCRTAHNTTAKYCKNLKRIVSAPYKLESFSKLVE